MIEKLDDSNLVLYAAKHYDNPHCYDTAEFYDDLNRFKYVKRLFNRYIDDGVLKERLIINHLITIYNVFGIEAATRILFFKIEERHYPILKPFLILLNFMPDVVHSIGPEARDIHSSSINMNRDVIEVLRNI